MSRPTKVFPTLKPYFFSNLIIIIDIVIIIIIIISNNSGYIVEANNVAFWQM